jgi:predicted regulator of Ras-like GTPase activity (Roadblock/LC7/MglB family)
LIRGPEGYAVMMAAASGTMLLVLATKAAKLGLLFLDMDRAVKDIAKVL